MTSNTIKSYAKINLGLKILNKRPDNFHNISSIFIQIDFHDTIEFIEDKIFSLECNNPKVPIDKNNTIAKVYNILNEKYRLKKKFKIILNK